VYIEGFTRRTQILSKPTRPPLSELCRRTSQTPDVVSTGSQRVNPASPLIVPSLKVDRTPSMWTLREGFSNQAQLKTVVKDLKEMQIKQSELNPSTSPFMLPPTAANQLTPNFPQTR